MYTNIRSIIIVLLASSLSFLAGGRLVIILVPGISGAACPQTASDSKLSRSRWTKMLCMMKTYTIAFFHNKIVSVPRPSLPVSRSVCP